MEAGEFFGHFDEFVSITRSMLYEMPDPVYTPQIISYLDTVGSDGKRDAIMEVVPDLTGSSREIQERLAVAGRRFAEAGQRVEAIVIGMPEPVVLDGAPETIAVVGMSSLGGSALVRLRVVRDDHGHIVAADVPLHSSRSGDGGHPARLPMAESFFLGHATTARREEDADPVRRVTRSMPLANLVQVVWSKDDQVMFKWMDATLHVDATTGDAWEVVEGKLVTTGLSSMAEAYVGIKKQQLDA